MVVGICIYLLIGLIFSELDRLIVIDTSYLKGAGMTDLSISKSLRKRYLFCFLVWPYFLSGYISVAIKVIMKSFTKGQGE